MSMTLKFPLKKFSIIEQSGKQDWEHGKRNQTGFGDFKDYFMKTSVSKLRSESSGRINIF